MNELNMWLLFAQYALNKNNNAPITNNAYNKISAPITTDFKTSLTKEIIQLNGKAEDFVQKMLPYAQKIADDINAPVSVLLAQGALESGWGKSMSGDNNLFGIKDKSGKLVSTQEFLNGKMVKVQDNFKNYANISDSWGHYGKWLKKHIGTSEKTIEQFMSAMSVSGYATDPDYAKKLGKIANKIEKILHLS